MLIALDEARGINNGQPSLWAKLYDEVNLRDGMHVVHIGAGAGYYTAIIAEIVAPRGRVMAIEVDAQLAARARDNLTPCPHAIVVVTDGFAYRGDQPADAIVVNARVSHIPLTWIDVLWADAGRLLPTNSHHKRPGL